MDKKRFSSWAFAWLAACVVSVGWTQERPPGPQRLSPETPRLALPDTTLLNDVEEGRARSAPVHDGSRWIGIAAGPVPEILRAHVSLPAGVGILVEQVVPDGPADQAGLRRHDILMELDGVPLADVRTLIQGVRTAQDRTLELKWLRRGQQMSAQLAPVQRPGGLSLDSAPRRSSGTAVNPQELGRLRDWIDRLEQNPGAAGPSRFHFFDPNFTPNPGQQAFENNIKVQIERQNDEPAEIKVEKDGNTWELTEDDLDQLPNDVRAHVESMLGGRAQFSLPNFRRMLPPGTPPVPQAFPDDLSFPEFESQLEEMNERMERMFDELRQLRQTPPAPIPAPEVLEKGDEA